MMAERPDQPRWGLALPVNFSRSSMQAVPWGRHLWLPVRNPHLVNRI